MAILTSKGNGSPDNLVTTLNGKIFPFFLIKNDFLPFHFVSFIREDDNQVVGMLSCDGNTAE